MAEEQQPAREPIRILHCHSTFAAGGKELRSVQLMNAFGDAAQHTIVSAEPDQMGARAHINKGVKVEFPQKFPSLKGWPTPGRLADIAKAMRDFDLILTYNWGAMDAVMAHTIFVDALKLPPLIHHEDGFNSDEVQRLKRSRNWFRQVALRRTHSLVVPSRVLEAIALGTWKQPRSRLRYIANGIDTARFSAQPDPSRLRLIKRKGERWVGTLAGLRPVKQLPMMVRAFAALPEEWQLVILGDGEEREEIQSVAEQLDIAHRVHLPGAVTDPAAIIGMFDIFALSSQSEQAPLSVIEAMAAGLPVAAPDVGDIRSMIAQPNREFLATPGDTGSLAGVLQRLASDETLRGELGKANKTKAISEFDAGDMVEKYRALYWGVARKNSASG